MDLKLWGCCASSSSSPHLLRDLKQSLLQLANLYAISGGGRLPDRLALCYVHRSRACGSLELKYAYIPRQNFSRRDFHHAVNNLPSDSYSPEPTEVGNVTKGDLAMTISKNFSKDALHSWGSNDILRKVIYISSYLEGKIDGAKKALVDAAEQCISLEFMLMEQELNQHVDTHERLKEFSNSISDLENCILLKCFPDIWVLYGLVKKWLHEVKDDGVHIHQAVFVFKNNLARSANQIFCKLLPSTYPIVDGFNPCKACRCHGLPIGNSRSSPPSCPVTNLVLECQNLVDNVISIGENTILFLPSFENFSMPSKISFPIIFKIMTRTSLASLTEALFMGTSYFVAPSACHEMEIALDEQDNSEMNCQSRFSWAFKSTSYSRRGTGMLFSSQCNTDTMRETTLQCFYLLQPSDKGLLRRMAGSEETLPLPNVIVDVQVPKDIEGSIQASLLKMESRDYSPLLSERGLHSKLNCLVKESLHFGSIPKSARPEPSNPNPVAALPAVEVSDNDSEGDNATMEDSSASIAQEWEQLIVHEVRGYSPTCIIKSVVDKAVQSPEVRPLDEKTSRILERLELPKSQKVQCSSPANTNRLKTEICAPFKKPLVPFDGNRMKDSGSSLSQPMKPILGKLKRKQRWAD